jgi:formate dehydrogenase subunit gamma
LAKEESNIDNMPGLIYDSTKMTNVGGVKSRGLPGYYFPLVIGIIALEFAALIFALYSILPIRTFVIYPTAAYFSYIAKIDLTQISVIITKWFFFFLTAGVMIPTTLIIVMEITRRVIIARRGEADDWYDSSNSWLDRLEKPWKNPKASIATVEGDYIRRFDIHTRIQHILLMVSFILLAVTGLLRGFPDWPSFSFWTTILGGPEFLRYVHNAAAIVMFFDCIYHILYIVYGYFVKGKFPYAMLPSLKDVKDMLHTFLWIFGQHKHEPRYERYQYGQKIDYWAIFWGMPVMGLTGIIMMLPAFFSQWLPGQWFAVAAAAHRDEAILATFFILIVHMYYGHLATIAFPMNTVIFTGRMLKSKYKQWFSREYAQITGDREE